MKANEAPEKIYLIRNFSSPTALNTTNDHHGKFLNEWYKSREKDVDVEYTRTDAFIEKVLRYLDVNFYFNNSRYSIECRVFDSKEEMIEDFKKYIKG